MFIANQLANVHQARIEFHRIGHVNFKTLIANVLYSNRVWFYYVELNLCTQKWIKKIVVGKFSICRLTSTY